ncbi:MAG: hypothetical protein K0T01_418 [Acidimicrobiia bacterium]|nr:hypothetical protein [Acidimicrobiia bacterium]
MSDKLASSTRPARDLQPVHVHVIQSRSPKPAAGSNPCRRRRSRVPSYWWVARSAPTSSCIATDKPHLQRHVDADRRHGVEYRNAYALKTSHRLSRHSPPYDLSSAPVPQLSDQRLGELRTPYLGALHLPVEQRARHILDIEALGPRH